MAKKITADDLWMLPCECQPGQPGYGGVGVAEFYPRARDAALALKRHVEEGNLFSSVHYTGGDGPDIHVIAAVVDGMRYGPLWIGPA